MLGIDLLREQAPDGDPAFFRIADAALAGTAGDGSGADDAGGLTPLTLAMLRKGGGSLPPGAVANADPLLLHGLASRSEARRVGKACVRTCRSRGWPQK